MKRESNKEGGFHYAWVILIVAMMVLGVYVPVVNSLSNTWQIAVTEDLGFSRTAFSFTGTITQAVGIFFGPVVSVFLTKYNFKRIRSAAAIAFAAAVFGYFLVQNKYQFYVLALVVGAAYITTAQIPMMMLIKNWFSDKKGLATSMPELGINAIMTAAEFIQNTRKQFDEITNNPEYHNDELGATLNVFSVIEGGRQFNSVPDHVVMKGNARTVPEYDSARAVELLQAAVDKNNENPEKAGLTLELNQVLDAAEAKKETALIRALKEAGKDKNIQVRPLIGTCELSRYIHLPQDVDLVVYGPGLTQMAHKVDEYIELDEYEDTIRIFKDMAKIFTESK